MSYVHLYPTCIILVFVHIEIQVFIPTEQRQYKDGIGVQLTKSQTSQLDTSKGESHIAL